MMGAGVDCRSSAYSPHLAQPLPVGSDVCLVYTAALHTIISYQVQSAIFGRDTLCAAQTSDEGSLGVCTNRYLQDNRAGFVMLVLIPGEASWH